MADHAWTNDTSGNCTMNVTIEDVKNKAIAIGPYGLVSFVLIAAGLVAEFVFIVRGKNNFLLRLFVYLSLAALLSTGMLGLHLVSYVERSDELFCTTIHGILYYSVTAVHLLVFAMNVVLIQKVCSSVFSPCARKWTGNNCYRVLIEAVFVVGIFAIPIVSSSIFMVTHDPDQLNTWFACYEDIKLLPITDCDHENWSDEQILLLAPVVVNVCLTLVCITFIIAWFVYLQWKQILKANTRKIFKEIVLLLGYLISYFISAIVSLLASMQTESPVAHMYIYPSTFVVIPILFFIYMCGSLCQRHKEVPATHTIADQSGCKTYPPSTRISLPTDTAAHAPNFLSPSSMSEVTEITPLLTN